jgi:hypothetical protein
MGMVYFALVAVGTVGLVVGEFVEVGRAFTLVFAAANLVGLVGVAAQLFGARPRRG